MAVATFWIILILVIVTAFMVNRYVKSSSDYYVMGKKGETIGITGVLTASYLSAVTFVGIAGIEYLNGPPIFLICYGSWIGMVCGFIYVGRRLRAYGAITMPDYLQERFGTSVRIIATVILIVGLLGYGVVQLMGAGVLLSSVTGISYNIVIIVFAIALITFCAVAGMYSVVIVNTLLLVTILVACFVLAPIMLKIGGGFDGLTNGLMNIDPNFWSAGGRKLHMPTGWTVGQFVLWALFFPAAPWIAGMALPCKNDFVLMRAICWSTLITTVGVVTLFLGCSAMYLVNPNISPADQVFIWACKNSVHPILGGLGIAGVMAAILSSGATIFMGAGFGLSRDLYERYIMSKGGKLEDKQKIVLARIAQVVVGVIVVIFALSKPLAIYWISAWAGALFATAWLPTLIAGFEYKKATRAGVIAGMLCGAGSYILLYQCVKKWKLFTLPFNLDPVIFGIIISFVAILVVSSLGKAKEEDMAVFTRVKGIGLAEGTIQSMSRGEIVKEYLSTRVTAWVCIIIAVVVLGLMAIRIVPAVSGM
jgi:sodium/pantothenate symporter